MRTFFNKSRSSDRKARNSAIRNPRRVCKFALQALVAAIMVDAAHSQLATETRWQKSGVGDWFTLANWSNQIPSFTRTYTYIDNGGTAQITTPGAQALQMWVGGGTVAGVSTLEISGAGSAYIASLAMGGNSIGGSEGHLTISNGGKLTGIGGAVGSSIFSTGSALITGPGSSWSISSETFYLGVEGNGKLILENDGVLNVLDGTGVLNMAEGRISEGTLQIGNGGKAGQILASEIRGGPKVWQEGGYAGSANIVFNHTESSYVFAPEIDGFINISHVNTGTTIINTDAKIVGNIAVTKGTLIVNHRIDEVYPIYVPEFDDIGDPVEPPPPIPIVLEVGVEGTLKGSGFVGGKTQPTVIPNPDFNDKDDRTDNDNPTIIVSSKAIIKGTVAGALTFENDLFLESTARVVLELASMEDYEHLSVGDQLAYDGTLELIFTNGYIPEMGHQFQLFSDFNGFTGAFDNIVYSMSGVEGIFDHETGLLSFTSISVPEPRTAMLAALALGAILCFGKVRFFRAGTLAVLLAATLASASASLEWDFKELTINASPYEKEVKAQFPFINKGTEPVTITSLRSTCGCVVAKVKDVAIQPGEHDVIEAVFEIDHRVGRQKRPITIKTDDPENPVIALYLYVDIPQVVEITPSVLSWNENEKLESKSFDIAVNPKYPLEKLTATTKSPAFDVKVTPEGPSDKYTVKVTPKETNPTGAYIAIDAKLANSPLTKVSSAFAAVQRAKSVSQTANLTK